jgi:hypothetical protein
MAAVGEGAPIARGPSVPTHSSPDCASAPLYRRPGLALNFAALLRQVAIIEARGKAKFKSWDDLVARNVIPGNAESAIKNLVSF